MHRIILFFLFLLLSQVQVLAQVELSSFSATGRGGVMNTFVSDYQAIGVNPSNLARGSNLVAFTVFEGGAAVSSKTFTRQTLRQFLNISDAQSISMADRQQFARAFASNNVLNIGADLNTFAISANLGHLGSFAFSNRQRMLGNVAFNKNFAELAFLGDDAPIYDEVNSGDIVYVSDVFDGTAIKASWLNEWNLAYGRKLLELPLLDLYAGVGYKYLQGMAIYEFSALDGNVKAYNAAAPVLDIDYSEYINSPGFNYKGTGGLLRPVGHGHGFDLGISAEINKMVKAALSVTDIGKITWNENLLQGQDNGFRLPPRGDRNNDDYWDEFIDIAQNVVDSAFTFTPVDQIQTSLPTRLRAGVGMQLGKRVEVGLDFVAPLNKAPGNLASSFVGLGVDFMPVRFIRLSSGLSTGAGEKFNLPLGFSVVTPVYEFGIATRDIVAPFSENNPGASFAMGFLRFKIGKAVR
ncbi:hypothetical protein FVR03_03325 [Pontibacter qinzhouensis]|uniref:DUF5723 domain-containing protein n=1 Tax=Pontibacter qinzhouensis TaxID=2603253 RepID=A0A5C8KEH6_9BACT|nr:DUF5723 family protein [Pontibacter qinzhouensis]TXK51573.1 hypothetical protein FVR03_03325 [Pontibacter qinzhouensis]